MFTDRIADVMLAGNLTKNMKSAVDFIMMFSGPNIMILPAAAFLFPPTRRMIIAMDKTKAKNMLGGILLASIWMKDISIELDIDNLRHEMKLNEIDNKYRDWW